MRTVTTQMDVVDLPEQMNAMRACLDEHRCELSSFNCDQSGAGVLVYVAFTRARVRKTLAIRPGGRLTANALLPPSGGSFGSHRMLPVIGGLRSPASNMRGWSRGSG
jgi:hypothetical protein